MDSSSPQRRRVRRTLNNSQLRESLVLDLKRQVWDRELVLRKKIQRGEPEFLYEFFATRNMLEALSQLYEVIRDEAYFGSLVVDFYRASKSNARYDDWANIAATYSYERLRRFVFERVCSRIEFVKGVDFYQGGTPTDEWELLKQNIDDGMYDLGKFFEEFYRLEEFRANAD